jgi:chitin synthase
LRRKQSTASGVERGRVGPNAVGSGSVRHNHNGEEKLGCLGNFAPGPKDAWMVYCYLLTICIPGFVLSSVFGEFAQAIKDRRIPAMDI